MDLYTIWFILVAILFTGFFLLEGFDYGVGMLLPFLGKGDEERRMIINTIGPVWDGNEVWMITAGGALFASFPQVYATLFSGFYLVMILLLFALILRGVGFEFRGKGEKKTWRGFWDWAIFTGSFVPAFLWGAAIGNLMRGFAIGPDMNYYGGILPLLNPYALLGGVVFVSLFVLHGANYLTRKTTGSLLEKVQKVVFPAWIITTILAVGFLLWSILTNDILSKLQGIIPGVLGVAALLITGYFIRSRKMGWGFVMGSLTILFLSAMIFAGLYPRILISSYDPSLSLTITNASSSHYTLKVMSIVAAIFVPIVILYQIWAYRVFRERVGDKKEKMVY